MSNRTVLIALLAAAVLAAVTVLSFIIPGKSGAAAVTSGSNLGLLTGNVNAFTVTQPIGESDTITIARASVPGIADAWNLKHRSRTFASEPARARTLMSILASATALGTVPPASRADALAKTNGIKVIMLHEDRTESSLQFGPRGIGGTVLVKITDPTPVSNQNLPTGTPGEPRFAIVSGDLESLFQTESLLTWRLSRPMSELAQQPSRIRLIMPAGTLAFQRTGANWSLTEPVTAAADGENVAKLLKALEIITIVRFFDDAPPALATEALAKPQARLIIERDIAAIGGGPGDRPAERTTQRREIRIGSAPADPARKTLFASLDDDNFVYAIDAAPLLGLTIDPTKFISATALDVPSGEIGSITIRLLAASVGDGSQSVTFNRTLDGWTEQRADGQAVLLTKDRGSDVQSSLDFFTKTKANSITLSRPEPNAELAAVHLFSLDGQPLAKLIILAAEGGGSNLFIGPETDAASQATTVWRSYPKMSTLLDFLISPTLDAAAKKLRDAQPQTNPAESAEITK